MDFLGPVNSTADIATKAYADSVGGGTGTAISALPSMGTLDGTEVLAGVQSSTTKKVTINSVKGYIKTADPINLADFSGWDSTDTPTMRAAQDAAATAAWGGTYTRPLEIPHHPTLAEHRRDTPFPYTNGMLIRGMGTSREFNGPSDVRIKYSGGSQFFVWPTGTASQSRFENLLFCGNEIVNTTSQFYVASGSMELSDVEFVDCSWQFFQNVIDSPCTRVTFMGEQQYINNGAGKQLDLRGSDCKIRGNLFVDCWPTPQTTYIVNIQLSMSEIDRMYVTPAPHMGVRFYGICTGLKARLVVNGLTPATANYNGNTTYATTANFPTASTVTGMLFKATNDVKTYRSNGSTYTVFWDGVAPTNVTSLPAGTLGQIVKDTNSGVDPTISYYRYDGSKWIGPRFHTSTTLGTYDGSDGPAVTFDTVRGSLDLDLYTQLTGLQPFSTKQGTVQFVDCYDDISLRVDHDFLNPVSGFVHYDVRDSSLPVGTSVKARIQDNLGRAHLGGRVENPTFATTGDVRIDYPRATVQDRAHRPTTWETVAGATLSSSALTLNTLYLAPFSTARRITAAAFEVMATVASATARIVIYKDDNNGYPGVLAYDSGAVTATPAGVKNPGTQPNLPPGRYWVGLVAQTAAANVRTFTGVIDGIPQSAAGGANMSAISVPSITGAPPNPFSGTMANQALLPIVWLQST